MRGRATGRLCVVIRGVVSDAVSCLFNGVLCDLPFNVVGLPKKMGGIIAHPSMICQSPHAAFSSSSECTLTGLYNKSSFPDRDLEAMRAALARGERQRLLHHGLETVEPLPLVRTKRHAERRAFRTWIPDVPRVIARRLDGDRT